MTKNTLQRLAIFFLGIPLYILVVLRLGFARNLILVAFVLLIQYQALGETAALFALKGLRLDRIWLTILALATGVFAYLSPWLSSVLPGNPAPLGLLAGSSILGCLAVVARFAFSRKEDFGSILERMAGSVLCYLYCGVLGAFLVYIASCLGLKTEAVFSFSLMTLGNDSLAWLSGMTLGRKRGIVAVSPNKSAAGFLGGLIGSLAAGGLSCLLFPALGGQVALPALLGLGACVGVSTILGDLVESAMKRSAGVKDSSNLIPGRGGVLDSVDSLLFSGPVFVLAATFLGLFGA